MPSVGLGARRELLEEESRSGHVLDVLVKDPGDAAELRRTLRAVALDEPQERVDHGGVELGPATAEELGAGVLDRLRRLVRATAHDDLERVRRGHDIRLDRHEIAAELVGIAGAVVALVMRSDDRHEVPKGLDRIHDRRPEDRVAPHDDPLVG